MAFRSNSDRRLMAAESSMQDLLDETPLKSKRVFWEASSHAVVDLSVDSRLKRLRMGEIIAINGDEYMVGVNPHHHSTTIECWKSYGFQIREYAAWAAHRRNVRRTADRIGLAYWPALIQKRNINPSAYKIAEEVMVSAGNGTYGAKEIDGSMSRGGWDMKGYKGISPYQVGRYWFMSGCKDGGKFRKLVRNHGLLEYSRTRGIESLIKKGTPMSHVAPTLKGFRWWKHHEDRIGIRSADHISPKVFRAIGMLSPALRWAAVSGLDTEWPGVEPGSAETVRLRVRDLNWTAVKAVQDGKVHKNHYVHKDITSWGVWWKIFSNKGLEVDGLKTVWEMVGRANVRHMGISPKQVLELAERCAGELGERMSPNAFIPAWNLCRLFGKNSNALETHIARAGNVHDAGQLRLPAEKISPVWGGWIVAKPTLAAKTHLITLAEEWLGGPPATLQEAVDALNAVAPPPGTDMLDSMPEHTRKAYLSLMPKAKTWEAIPAPHMWPIGEYSIQQLAVGDIRAPMAGLLTDCCQHLHGAAASCAALSYTSAHVAVWAVFKGSMMVAQSLVWKSKDQDSLVLDSVEALGGYKSNTTAAALFISAAQSVVGRLGVKKVLLSTTRYGMTHTVLDLVDETKIKKTPEPAVSLGYSDATPECVVIASIGKGTLPKAHKNLPTVDVDVSDEATCIDEYAEDSGVFCEHCGAEVHPLCCTCPECGADITEWVDDDDEYDE